LFGIPGFVYAQEDINVTISPQESNEPILNSGTGLTIPTYVGNNGNPEALTITGEYANIAYRKFRWADLEPTEGAYDDFPLIREWMDIWTGRGYRVAFGIASSSGSGAQATPLWVFEDGVPGLDHCRSTSISESECEQYCNDPSNTNCQRDPVYWNDLYLQKLRNFVRALGAEFNNNEHIDFLDLRNIGVFGEMHFGEYQTLPIWTQEELSEYYNHAELEAAYASMIDSYKQAFPDINLFLNIAPQINRTYSTERIIANAVSEGINLRYDGLTVHRRDGLIITPYELTPWLERIFEIFRQYGYNSPGQLDGARCILEFGRGVSSVEELDYLLEAALANDLPTSHINLNFGRLTSLNQTEINLVNNAALRVGYRYVLRSFNILSNPAAGDTQHYGFSLNQTWENVGSAPGYENYRLEFFLTNESSQTITSVSEIPSTPVYNWDPGATIQLNTLMAIPNNLSDGSYLLKVRMVDPGDPSPGIGLAIGGFDGVGAYTLLRLNVISGNWSVDCGECQGLPGDTNHDGSLNIADAVICVNVILGFETNPDYIARAKAVTVPTNEANILDLMGIINVILGV